MDAGQVQIKPQTPDILPPLHNAGEGIVNALADKNCGGHLP